MKLSDLYVLLLRLAGVILGYYWISAMVWAFYYFANPDEISTWMLIAQYAIQGGLLYLLIFKTSALVRFLFGKGADDIDTVQLQARPDSLVIAGISVVGLVLILWGLPSLIMTLFSRHRFFVDYDEGLTLVTKREIALSIIHIILGIVIIGFQKKIAGWIMVNEPEKS